VNGKKRYIAVMALGLALCWFLFDVLLVDDETFEKIEEYTFEEKSELAVRAKIRREIKRFESSTGSLDQVYALVHLMECNYYLLYHRFRRLERYYDFVKVVLYPGQRGRLKNKQEYVRQAGRYLKRKRNLDIIIEKYEISRPRLSGDKGEERVEVPVIRQLGAASDTSRTRERLTYHFRRHTDQRFYLYFKQTNRLLEPWPRQNGERSERQNQ
jgi:hypothetical protein